VARIDVDLDRVLGTVDRRIFGAFVEHLGRCIYGGIFEPGSPLSDARGFRTDVLDAARALRPPLLRWPGGNFVSGYHWVDGIGPAAERPRRLDLAWHAEEPNTFGTDEFIAYCRALDSEPYICLNMGTGTLDEAIAWVDYCNGTGGTAWAERRRANGHAEPYNVRYWGLGNELWGQWQIGHQSAEEYVAEARRWADALRRLDPSLVLIACGRDGWSDWDQVVIDGLVSHVDYHSIHIYTGSDDYWSNVLAPHQAERAVRLCQAMIDRARYVQRVDRPVHVAYDEWNVWFRERSPTSGLEERYTLADALAVATYLNVFVRQCQSVRIANQAQLVNVIAPIMTRADGLFLQTIYHPLRLHVEHDQEVVLDPRVVCESVTHADSEAGPRPHRLADLGPFKLLDVAATRDLEGRRLTLTVVNRSPHAAVSTTVETHRTLAAGGARVHVVDGPAADATNSFAEPNLVAVRTQPLPVQGTSVELVLPPHSFSCVTLAVDEPGHNSQP
jgi:alpha-L-arabinofuranosidase